MLGWRLMALRFPRLRLQLIQVGSCRHPECVAVSGGRWKPVVFPSLVAVIQHPDAGIILFDTGYAPQFFQATEHLPERLYRWITPVSLPPAQQLLPQLAQLGITPADVRHVFLSHLHADHVAGLCDLPKARIWFAQSAWLATRDLGRLSRLRRGTLSDLLPDDFESRLQPVEHIPQQALPAAWRDLGGGHDLIGDGSLWAVPLPGHARGHHGLLLRLESDAELLLVGDATWQLRDGRVAAPSFVTRLLCDDWQQQRQTLASLQRLLDADPARLLLPSHCESSLARVQAELPGLLAVPRTEAADTADRVTA